MSRNCLGRGYVLRFSNGLWKIGNFGRITSYFLIFYMLKISTEKDICGCSNFPSEHLHECTSTLSIKMHENSQLFLQFHIYGECHDPLINVPLFRYKCQSSHQINTHNVGSLIISQLVYNSQCLMLTNIQWVLPRCHLASIFMSNKSILQLLNDIQIYTQGAMIKSKR